MVFFFITEGSTTFFAYAGKLFFGGCQYFFLQSSCDFVLLSQPFVFGKSGTALPIFFFLTISFTFSDRGAVSQFNNGKADVFKFGFVRWIAGYS